MRDASLCGSLRLGVPLLGTSSAQSHEKALLLRSSGTRSRAQVFPRWRVGLVCVTLAVAALLAIARAAAALPSTPYVPSIAPSDARPQSKPAILALVYFRCPKLCTLVLNGLTEAMQATSMTAGREFEVITVSFDPKDKPDKAAAKKKNYLARYGRDGAAAGWHFLTGEQESIKPLADAVGFHYTYDPVSDQYAHASGIMVLTPQGKIARYLYGISYSPRDVRLALVEASQEKIGSPVDAVLLYCFHYDARTGKYNADVMNFVRFGGGLTVAVLAGFFVVMGWRSWRRPGNSPPASP